MAEVGDKLRLRPRGQLVPYELYIKMLDGDFFPNWAIDKMTLSDYH